MSNPGGCENLFFSAKDTIRLVYSAVDSCSLLFGIALNALLIYLIRTKTVPAMKVYSKLLALSCVMDLIVSCWNFILQPIPCVDHGVRTVLSNGYFRNHPQPIRYAVYLIWIHLMLFFLVTTICQYVDRFCILCKEGREGHMPRKIFWSTIMGCSWIMVVHAFVLSWADFPRSEDRVQIMEMERLVHEESGINDVSFVAFGNGLDFRWRVHLALMCVIFPGFYVVIFYCMAKIHKAINEMNTLKLQEYNRQVSAAMLFQAILPTLEIGAWSIQIFLPLFITQRSTVWAIVFSDIPIHLIPAINPLGTILLVAPYRRAFLTYLGLQQASTTIIRTATRIWKPTNRKLNDNKLGARCVKNGSLAAK